MVCFIVLSACARRKEPIYSAQRACENKSIPSGEEIDFHVKVVAFERSALHLDFDAFGADFSSAEVLVESPDAWRGTLLNAYYQGLPLLGGKELTLGSSFNFKAIPPICLDQPWLFLSDIEAKYTSE